MRVYVEPVGLLKRTFNATVVELQNKSTIQDLIQVFNLPKELRAIALIKGKRQSHDHNLEDGDSVKLVCLALGG
ncbi:MAG: hypothetical protein V1897_09010 [Pseudomonadota bacterium]